MKKLKVSVVTLLSMFAFLVGCTSPVTEKGEQYFNATVLELHDDSVKVKCTEEFNSGIKVGSEVLVPTKVVAAAGAPEMAVKDDIRVVFKGDTLDDASMEIGTVFDIYLLDEIDE